MEDKDKLFPDFASWEKAALNGEAELKKRGHVVVRAYIDPETFPEWCRKRGLRVDAQARIKFSNEAAYQQVKGTH